MTLETTLGSAQFSEIEGIHEDTSELKSLQETLDKILEAITGISSGEGKKADFVAGMGDKVKNTVGNEDGKGDDAKKGGAKKGDEAGQGKLGIKVGDLNGIQSKYIMGSLLVNSTLVELQKTLEKIANKVGKAGNQSAKGLIASNKTVDKSQHVEKQTNINFDPKKMDGMTKALLEFGKACIILSLIPVKVVKKATNFFYDFMMDMAKISIVVAKEKGDFEKTGKGIKDIVSSIKEFAIGCLLMAVFLPAIAISTAIGLPLMKRFVKGMVDITKDANPDALKELKNVGMFMILTGIAVAIFALDIFLLEKIFPKLPKAIVGLLVFAAFMALMIFIGVLATLGEGAATALAVFAISMAISLILFNIAIRMLLNTVIDKEKMNNFVDGIITMAKGFIKALPFLLIAIIGVALLAIFSVLLAISMVCLMVALLCMNFVNFLIGMLPKDEKTGEFVIINNIKMLAMQFADTEFIMHEIIGVVAVLLFAVFSILLAVSMIVFLIAVVAMIVVTILVDKIKDKDKYPAIEAAKDISIVFAENLGWFLLGAVAIIPATVFAVLLLVFSLALLVSVIALTAVYAIVKKLNKKDVEKAGSTLKSIGIGIMLNFLGVDSDNISLGGMIKAGINAAKMAALGVLALAAVIPMATFMLSLVTITASFKTLEENMDGIKPETIDNVMGGIGGIMKQLATVAEAFKGQSAKTITAVGGLVKDVAEAINLLTDVVLKLKDGIPEEQIDAATHSMLSICERLFGTPGQAKVEGQYTLTDTLETIARADLKNLNAEAIGAITPLMEGISAMADVVKKVGDTETFSEDVMRTGARNLNMFLELMTGVADSMQYLITAKDTGKRQKKGGILGKIGCTEAVMKSPLDAINEVIEAGLFDSMRTVFDSLGNVGEQVAKFKPENFEAITNFLAGPNIVIMTNQSQKFIEGMQNFATGIGYLKESALNNFRQFLSILGGANAEKINSTVNALSALGNAAVKFKSTADSFERMADALTKMAKNEGKISSIFKSLKDGAKASADLEQSTTAAVGGTTVNPYVEKIYDVLSDWSEHGVPVRGNAEGQIVPIDAGNSVGGSRRR